MRMVHKASACFFSYMRLLGECGARQQWYEWLATNISSEEQF
uniref:Uncharacterized protein n=1 Tax=Anguilla anguilla TaxID=7936 RepID=A0A0E9RZX5_ANGAN